MSPDFLWKFFLVRITGYLRLEFSQSHPMNDPNSVEADNLAAIYVERTQKDGLYLYWALLLVDSSHN